MIRNESDGICEKVRRDLHYNTTSEVCPFDQLFESYDGI
jgi:hypothetical protein